MDLGIMNAIVIVSYVVLWTIVLFLGFLLLGTLRAMGLLSWRLEQLEATTPSRIGRSGLKPGTSAPDFSLPSASGAEVALHDFSGRRLLLVFTQAGCGPCHDIIPELNRLHEKQLQVLVVNNGTPDESRQWAAKVKVRFSVLVQEHFTLSKRFEVFATPFAFLIDEKGIIVSKGIINNGQHIRFVLFSASDGAKRSSVPSGALAAEHSGTAEAHSPSIQKEASHV